MAADMFVPYVYMSWLLVLHIELLGQDQYVR